MDNQKGLPPLANQDVLKRSGYMYLIIIGIIVLPIIFSLLNIDIGINRIMPILLVLFLVFYFTFMMSARKKYWSQGMEGLSVIEEKIEEFNKRAFNSHEEKDKVRSELKTELVEIKRKIRFMRIRRAAEDKIMIL